MQRVLTALAVLLMASVANGAFVDFDGNGSVADFVAHFGSPSISSTVGETGNGLEQYANNQSTSIKYSPGGTDFMLGDGTVSADLLVKYYASVDWGNSGSVNGLMLKAFADDGNGQDGGYVVNLSVDGSSLTARIGCHDGPSGGSAPWDYLKDGVNHSAYVDLVLNNAVPDNKDNQAHSLGWWNVSADMTVVGGVSLQIDVTITAPDTSVYNASYTDSGAYAFVGDGQVGHTNAGKWSMSADMDNFLAVPEPTTLALLAMAGVAAVRRRK